ncbi:MAG: NAD(P)-dependent oxidoreductase [Saprospiraceae bacterium]
MRPRILIAETKDYSPEATALLRELGDVDLIETPKSGLKKALETYDVFWFRLAFRIEASDLPVNPRCRFIVCPMTGLDHIDLDACDAKGIQVLSLRGEYTFLRSVRATAELTIGLTLALLRNIPEAAKHVQAGGWDRQQFQGRELQDKTVGIAGMGRLGKITAQYFRIFGCHVLGFDPIPFNEEGVVPCESLKNLVAQSDIVSIHVNYLPENHHLFNEALFSNFKKGSVLINTARGALIDSTSLLRQLQIGHLSGAALDVIENEHKHTDSPLIAYARQHKHLIITPHIGGNTAESFEKTEVFLAEKLKSAIPR